MNTQKKNLFPGEIQHHLVARRAHLEGTIRNLFAAHTKCTSPKKKHSNWQFCPCPSSVPIDFNQTLLHSPEIKGIQAVLNRIGDEKIKTVVIKRTPTHKYPVTIGMAVRVSERLISNSKKSSAKITYCY